MLKQSIAAALLCSASAQAQELSASGEPVSSAPAESAQGRVVFEPAYFARYAPQSALDMVRRVPGFAIDEGGDRRGFSGSAGNVLIDGARPASKNQALSDVLARIPATFVAHVELIRDASSTADAAGHAMLVNVVRRRGGGSGVWELEAEAATENARITPRGEASWTGRAGALDYSVSGSHTYEYRPLDGVRAFRNGNGADVASGRDDSPRTFRETIGAAEASWRLFGGQARANLEIGRFRFAGGLGTESFDANGAPTRRDALTFDEHEDRAEIGATYARDIGPVSLEAIGLYTQRFYARDDVSTQLGASGAALSVVEQAQRQAPSETIARVRLSWPFSETQRLDVGVEGAFNTLETRLGLVVNGAPTALPAANVSIEEERAEAFATYVLRPAPRWTLEAQAAVETSTLTQSGDTALSTELTFWKPSLQATRRVGERHQVQARLYRDVGQLDFSDFASAAELADNRVAAGNPNLRPETSWRAELTGDMRFAEDGAVSVTVFRRWIEDAADVVPVGPPGQRFDAPGNIGEADLYGVTLEATIPLGFALPGAQVTIIADARRSAVQDPVTGRERPLSEFRGSQLEANFRQDLPAHKFAWGVSYYKERENPTYRLNEVDVFEEGPWLDLWAETTAIRGVKTRVFANAVLDSPFVRTRSFSTQDRTVAPDFVEQRTRRFGSFYGVRVSGTF